MQSPAKLFRSLKHGDPQAIAIAAVLVFLVSVCWFSYTLLFPPDDGTLPLGASGRRQPPPANEVSLSQILDNQRSYLTPADAPNPFYRVPPRVKPRPTPKPDTNKNPRETKPKPNPPTKTPPKPQGPKTKPLTLTYKGLMRRPDQSTVAVIHVAEENQQRFIQVGGQLNAFIINEITQEGVQIQEEKGPMIFIPFGETKRFEVEL